MTNVNLIASASISSGRFAMQDGSNSGERSSSVHLRDYVEHAPGDVLAGKYEIVSLLGQGGMGKVWRAHSLTLDIDVAIKVLHREHADVQAAERLLREARATAKLGHSAIVRAIDFGETDAGAPFLVMELLEGMSLAGWLQERGRMSATLAVQMLLPIADALAEAHKQGIVHRDIKPENIIAVPHEGDTYQPKIVDFGIAKLLTHDSTQVLTHAGMILGSLEYMSPEQAEGKLEVGEATDVWSLAIVLYELITGRRPFDGPTITAMMFALYTRAPAATTQFAAGDEELWQIIERGLQKSPADRWPSMRAFGRALAQWASERGIATDAAGTSVHHHWLAMPSQPLALPEYEEARPISEPPASVSATVAEPDAEPARSEPFAKRSREVIDPAYAATANQRLPRARTLVAGIVVLVAPVILAAGLYAHRGTASASTEAQPAATAAIAPMIVAAGAPTATSPKTGGAPTASPTTVDVAPEPAPVATAAPAENLAGTAAPASRARAPRSVQLKHPSTAMPLPATPNF